MFRLLCGTRVVGDASGDQFGAEIGLVGVIAIRSKTINLGFRIAKQALVLLETFHRHRISDQQNVRLRRASRKLGGKLGEEFARARAENLHIGVRIGLAESFNRLCRIRFRL